MTNEQRFRQAVTQACIDCGQGEGRILDDRFAIVMLPRIDGPDEPVRVDWAEYKAFRDKGRELSDRVLPRCRAHRAGTYIHGRAAV